MATINIQNATVQFVNNGKGFKVLEETTSGGRTFKQQYTVWAEPGHGYQVGDTVSVSGFLGAKVGKPWTGNDGVERASVELSVNSPTFTKSPASVNEAEVPF